MNLKKTNNVPLFDGKQNLIKATYQYNFERHIMKAYHMLVEFRVFDQTGSTTGTEKPKHVRNYAKHE